MTDINNSSYDEIDLRTLLFSIWEGRVFITFVVIIFLILAGFFSYYTSDIYKVSVKIRPVNLEEIEKYSKLKSSIVMIKSNRELLFAGEDNIFHDVDEIAQNFSSTYLFENFIDKLLDETSLLEAIQKSELLKKQNEGREENSSSSQLDLINSLNFKLNNEFEGFSKSYKVLETSFSFQAPEENIKKFVNIWYEMVLRSTQSSLSDYVNNNLNSYDSVLAYNKASLKSRIENLKLNYDEKIMRKIIYLE